MANVLQLKITLRDTKPPIWRRILVKDDITFKKFHLIIQAAMGWYNCHLYTFDMGNFQIGTPYEDAFEDIVDSGKVKLNEYFNKEGAKMKYTYDFGDNWEHLIVVEKVLPIEEGVQYPTCIKGKGSCPPEDCGGVWGYYELINTIKDKKHPDYEDMLEWLGGSFDPNDLDIGFINRKLKKV